MPPVKTFNAQATFPLTTSANEALQNIALRHKEKKSDTLRRASNLVIFLDNADRDSTRRLLVTDSLSEIAALLHKIAGEIEQAAQP
jgi:hypothetical protein